MSRLVIILGALLLASCAEDEPRSVQWFKDHEAERKSVMVACDRDAVPASVECLNAQKADDELSLSRRGYVKPKPVAFD